jgi:hypothetical protein
MGHLGVLKKRRESLEDNNIIIPELIYQQSIVKKYFLERTKIYSSLGTFNENN